VTDSERSERTLMLKGVKGGIGLRDEPRRMCK